MTHSPHDRAAVPPELAGDLHPVAAAAPVTQGFSAPALEELDLIRPGNPRSTCRNPGPRRRLAPARRARASDAIPPESEAP